MYGSNYWHYCIEHKCQISLLNLKKIANSKKKFGIYVRCNNENNCYHTLSFIALFLPVITFSVNINFHSQLFHQEIVF